jgi:regulator of sigma E protease
MQLLEPFLRSGWNILLVVLGLGLIVFLHELGHFLLAKKNGVRVEAFSLGFGPVIWKRQHGDTEYRLSVFPLGGYVKMAGEGIIDDRPGAPDELTSKTPWQRFQIFVAGATMNLLIAFPIGVAAYAIGKVEPSNVVGQPGYAEALAGIRPGDVVLQVGDRKIDSLEKLLPEMIRRRNGTEVPVKVRRIENGAEVEKTFLVTARSSAYHQTGTVNTFVQGLREGSPLHAAGLRNGDLITAFDGEPVQDGFRLLQMLSEKQGQEVTLAIRRLKADWTSETPAPVKVKVPGRSVWKVPVDLNLVEARVGAVGNGSAAWGALEPKDRVLSIDGQPVRSWGEMLRAVEARPLKECEIRVEREGKGPVTLKVRPGVKANGRGILGVSPHPSDIVAYVEPGSYSDLAGLKAGDRLSSIVGVNTKDPKITGDGFGAKTDRPGDQPAPPPVDLRMVRDGKVVPVVLKYEKVVEADLAALGLETKAGIALGEARLLRERTFSDAFAAGMREPVDVTVLTFDILRKLIMLEESAKGLSGPIGIFAVTFKSVELSFGNYLWLLCLITVNLGVFNLLPIPVLDGGHNVLLLIEVVRKWFGKGPPSPRFVAAFQYSGLLFILCLFVMVTFNDISRIFGG